jgi:hypothetical protein
MPRPVNKTELLDESKKEYEALEKFLSNLTPDQMTQTHALGEWSVKDVLAHLYEWQQMFFRWYEAGLRGEMPAIPAEGYKWNQLPALNQAIYERYQDYPLADILNNLQASHQKTIALIESLSEDALFAKGLYPWMNDNRLASYLTANTGSHYRWARTEMRKHVMRNK